MLEKLDPGFLSSYQPSLKGPPLSPRILSPLSPHLTHYLLSVVPLWLLPALLLNTKDTASIFRGSPCHWKAASHRLLNVYEHGAFLQGLGSVGTSFGLEGSFTQGMAGRDPG